MPSQNTGTTEPPLIFHKDRFFN